VAVCREYQLMTEELRTALYARTAAVPRRQTSIADKSAQKRGVAKLKKEKVAPAFARLLGHVQNCPRCNG